MSATIWLRVSASISLLFAVGHSLGGMQNWSPVAYNPVLESMRTVHFDVMGMNRSYLDLYMGFGYAIGVSLLLQSALLWMLSNMTRAHAPLVRPMIAAFAVAVALTGLVAWRLIFAVPALFCLALCVTLIVTFVVAQRSQSLLAAGANG